MLTARIVLFLQFNYILHQMFPIREMQRKMQSFSESEEVKKVTKHRPFFYPSREKKETKNLGRTKYFFFLTQTTYPLPSLLLLLPPPCLAQSVRYT